MGRIGKISPIIKDVSSAFPTMDTSLRQRGLTRYPGTFKMMFPHRELNNKWRTGLDPEAQYIKEMKRLNKTAGEAEAQRVSELKAELEEKLDGVDLSPTSKYWATVAPVKLIDGENLFDMNSPERALAFAWLRVHPQIAPSLAAWEAGLVSSELAFYVKDDDAEAKQTYRKEKAVNDAIVKFTSFSNDKRIKVARLMGISIMGDETEEIVYTRFVNVIRAIEMNSGPYKGSSPVLTFERFAIIPDDQLEVFNLIELALRNNVYRTGIGGRIYEGETPVFNSKEEAQSFFLNEKNQDQLLLLKDRVKVEKLVL